MVTEADMLAVKGITSSGLERIIKTLQYPKYTELEDEIKLLHPIEQLFYLKRLSQDTTAAFEYRNAALKHLEELTNGQIST